MAHGLPRINACYDCNQYTLVGRFSENPHCPTCGQVTQQTNKEELRRRYNLNFFYDFILGFNNWSKIKT